MNNVPQGNIELFEHVREALMLVYGKDYSLQQIQEAYTIAMLSSTIFRDLITKKQRERYCEHCQTK
ncbi:hypothetical protein C4568_00260 [Candidatus Parcubacteria bacterium]|nr:MAG: hypothetical protein C4568_00260 [Candidatus Parcubacteria bacterium]